MSMQSVPYHIYHYMHGYARLKGEKRKSIKMIGPRAMGINRD